MKTCLLILTTALLAVATAPIAAAQATPDAPSPLPAPLGPPAVDAQANKVMEALVGSYRADDLMLRISRIPTVGLPPSLYLEISQLADPFSPMWRLVLSIDTRGQTPIALVSEFPSGAYLGSVYTASWAAPDFFPKLTPKSITPLGILSINTTDDGYTLTSDTPSHAFRGGAFFLSFDLTTSDNTLNWAVDARFSDNTPAWSESEIFEGVEEPAIINKLDNGMLTITLAPGILDSPIFDDLGAAKVHYDAYTMSGLQFYSTSWRGVGSKTFNLPAGFVPGFDEALRGMQSKTKRRSIVPPWLAYGDKQRGAIPPNTWIIFDVEIVSVKPVN